MTEAQLPPARYSRVARYLHWATAGLVAVQIALGLVGHDLEGPAGRLLMAWHLRLGVLILALAMVRLAYRRRHPPAAMPAAMPGWQRRLAGLNHGLIYALLVALPLLGWLSASAAGETIGLVGPLALPPLMSANDAIADWAGEVHEFGAFALMWLVGLHVAAAAYHGLYRRDGIVRRML